MQSQVATAWPRMSGTDSALAPATGGAIAPVHWSASVAADDPVALLFTDIEGSTVLLERVGDHAWVEVLHRHHALVRGLVALHGGAVVHVLGDGFMVAFAEVGDAVGCAVAIQRRLAASPDPSLGVSLRVRMGVHTGPVIRDVRDYHGRTVVVAARIAARARGGEILVSEDVAASDPSPAHVRFALVGAVALKGLNRREILYSVDWRDRPAWQRSGTCRSGVRTGASPLDPGPAHRQRGHGSSASSNSTRGRSRFDLPMDDTGAGRS